MSDKFFKANTTNDAGLFMKAFEILASRSEEGYRNGKEEDIALMIPAAVNASFACELYLKSMIDHTVKEHKLDKLFAELDVGYQNLIKKLMVETGKSKDPSYDENAFMTKLTEQGNVFVDWRYFYEGASVLDNNFIKDLIYVLKGVCEIHEKGVDINNIEIKDVIGEQGR